MILRLIIGCINTEDNVRNCVCCRSQMDFSLYNYIILFIKDINQVILWDMINCIVYSWSLQPHFRPLDFRNTWCNIFYFIFSILKMAINVAVDILCDTCCVGKLFVDFYWLKTQWWWSALRCSDVNVVFHPIQGCMTQKSHLKTILELLFCALWYIQSQ